MVQLKLQRPIVSFELPMNQLSCDKCCRQAMILLTIIALQQYLSEDIMTFMDLTTAVKAGGTPNERGIVILMTEEVEYLKLV